MSNLMERQITTLKITSKGERVSIGRGSGREHFRYKYNLASYTSDNNEKDGVF